MKTPFCSGLYIACTILAGCEREPAPPASPVKPAAPAPQAPVQSIPTPAPGAGEAPAAGVKGNVISALGVSMPLPEGWKEVPPANQMRLIELQVADPGGDLTKVSTVAFSTAGGDVQSNITRWAGQMKDASKTDSTTKDIGGFKVSQIEMTGTYLGMGEQTRPDTTFRGAIVETPSGLLFIKMTGPASSMKASAEGWNTMIAGIKKQ